MRIVLLGLLSSVVVTAHAQTPTSSAAQRPETAKTQEQWRAALSRLPEPTTGCYTSAFPVVEWKVVACGTAPNYPVGQPRQQPEIAKTQSAWQRSLLRLPRQRPGCYAASFPRVEWKTAPCGTP